MKLFILLASLLAVGFGASITPDFSTERSFVDLIIKGVLEGLKPKLANLSIGNINETFVSRNLNASIIFKDIQVNNVDKFAIKQLKSNLVPLKIANLTLTWDSIKASACYDVNVTIDIPQIKKPISVFGKGCARASLFKLFFTIGAHLEMKNNSVQIKPKGLFGFDVTISSSNVTISSLMGSEELGRVAGVMISNVLPELVISLKKPLFNAFQDDIIKYLNQFLKKNGTSIFDDEPIDPDFSLPILNLPEKLLELTDMGDLGF